jgi:thiol-disulfide isomerase/thioredoxin
MKQLLTTLLFSGSMWLTNVYAQTEMIRAGALIGEISLPDTSGILAPLSGLKGKVVLIDFWASWCGPCRLANPGLLKIYNQYSGKNFAIYGISIDKSVEAWRKAIREDRLTWMQVNDTSDHDRTLIDKWGINYIPTSFLLNADGRIVAVNPNKRALKAYLKKHL